MTVEPAPVCATCGKAILTGWVVCEGRVYHDNVPGCHDCGKRTPVPDGMTPERAAAISRMASEGWRDVA